MAFLDRDAKNLLLGASVGAAAVLAAPFVLPVVAATLRPLLKAALTQSMLALEIGRERLSLMREHAEDAFAEAQIDARDALEQRRLRLVPTPVTVRPAATVAPAAVVTPASVAATVEPEALRAKRVGNA
jgi:division protein CdvB (Snf7/Vps24/ESCRT-III family)